MKKTYYMVDVSALMCYFEIRVNDVEVFSFNLEGQTRVDIPINQGILESGVQEIEVRCYPIKGTLSLHEEAYIRYKVVAFDVSSGDFRFLEQFEDYQTPKVQKGVPLTNHKSEFKATVPYNLDAWQSGVDLKSVKFEIKPKLIKAYENIKNKIEIGNYKEFIKTLKRREDNIATVMYLSSSEASQRMEKLIYDFNNGFKVLPILKESVVEFSGYGKLASLKRADGMSALALQHTETGEELILQPTFYIPEGKTDFEVI